MQNKNQNLDLDNFTSLLKDTAGALIECGCSSNRVETLCIRLGQSFGIEVDVMAIPTGAWIVTRWRGRTHQTLIRVRRWQIDLTKLSKINELVFDLDQQRIDWITAQDRLRILNGTQPPYSQNLQIIAGAGASGGVSYLSGAPATETIIATLLGALVMILARTLRGEQTRYLSDFFSAFVATTLTLLLAVYWPMVDSQRLIVSSLIVLVPGLSFVNAIHELAQKNLVSGSGKLFDSLMVAASLAFGVLMARGLQPFLVGTLASW